MKTDSVPGAVTRALSLLPVDTESLASLCGQFDEHLRLIEKRLQVTIANRGNQFECTGAPETVAVTLNLLDKLYVEARSGAEINPQSLHLSLQHAAVDAEAEAELPSESSNAETAAEKTTPAANDKVAPITVIQTRRGSVKPRGKNQQAYVRSIQQADLTFGVGPAGTGKTWLAVACAVEALITESVARIVLVRPAVEAGEKLGFLPGDLAQKIDPYLRPLYDALFEMMGNDTVEKLIEKNVIEIAPLAYMRGRTLNDAFIILDESQNTTREQMKMFVTRIGFGSKAVITGDATQIDLPRGTPSGLLHALKVLKEVDGIATSWFSAADVVRHPLVQGIIEAYDRESADTATLDSKQQ